MKKSLKFVCDEHGLVAEISAQGPMIAMYGSGSIKVSCSKGANCKVACVNFYSVECVDVQELNMSNLRISNGSMQV